MLLIFNYVLLFLMIFLALQMLLSHNTGISLHYKRKHFASPKRFQNKVPYLVEKQTGQ